MTSTDPLEPVVFESDVPFVPPPARSPNRLADPGMPVPWLVAWIYAPLVAVLFGAYRLIDDVVGGPPLDGLTPIFGPAIVWHFAARPRYRWWAMGSGFLAGISTTPIVAILAGPHLNPSYMWGIASITALASYIGITHLPRKASTNPASPIPPRLIVDHAQPPA